MAEIAPSPSIATTDTARGAFFMKPQLGVHLKVRCADADTTMSPRAETMAVRLLTLGANMAVPVHAHKLKEKVYVQIGGGPVRVLIWRGTLPDTFYLLDVGDCVAVPAGCPHALIVGAAPVKFLVVASSNDAEDIEWEANTQELLRNEHLNS